MAASAEIMGSRNSVDTNERRRIERLMVSDDGTTGISTPGTLFAGDTGVLGRRCVQVQKDPEALPSRFIVRETYEGFKAY